MYFNHPSITNVMPRDQLWTLGVDARDHQFGRLVYDKRLHGRGKILDTTEPGYADGMETALAFVLRSAGKELTPEYIGQVRRIACYFLYLTGNLSYGANPPNMQSTEYYPTASGNLPITRDAYSEKGIREVAEWGIWRNSSGWMKSNISLTPDNIQEFLARLKNEGQLYMGRNGATEYMREYIQQYHQWMCEAGNDNDQKLLAIAKFCRLIDCSHPFPDGNIRTVRLLMLTLMIQNNLTPTMMWDPNMIDAYHSSEIVREMKEGQHTYEVASSAPVSDLSTEARAETGQRTATSEPTQQPVPQAPPHAAPAVSATASARFFSPPPVEIVTTPKLPLHSSSGDAATTIISAGDVKEILLQWGKISFQLKEIYRQLKERYDAITPQLTRSDYRLSFDLQDLQQGADSLFRIQNSGDDYRFIAEVKSKKPQEMMEVRELQALHQKLEQIKGSMDEKISIIEKKIRAIEEKRREQVPKN